MAVHHGKLLLQEVLAAVCVMHEHIVEGVAVLSDSHGLESETILNQPPVAVLAEKHLLAVAEDDGVVGAVLLVDEV